MIDVPLLLAFAAAASILTVTPGVDTAMVLRTAAAGGRQSAIHAALGILIGCLLWGGAVALGLGALLRASELAYDLVKLAGAAYLLWLGVRLVLKPRDGMGLQDGAGGSGGHREAFMRGFLTNLLNPKVGVFYITFLPQFVPVGAPVGAYTLMLVSLHLLLTMAWFTVLIAATVPLGTLLRQPKVVRALDRITGGVFLLFGIRLAVSSAH